MSAITPELTASGAHWRRLRGYARSRRLPGYFGLLVVLLGMILLGRGWGNDNAPHTLWLLVLLVPVAFAAVVATSLDSPFGETERASGTWLPVGRALHLATMLGGCAVIAAVGAATWPPDGSLEPWGWYLLRHSLALIGLGLLASAVLDPRVSWVVPGIAGGSAMVTGYIREVERANRLLPSTFFHDGARHPLLQPHDAVLPWVLAVTLAVVGTVVALRCGVKSGRSETTAG